MFYSSANHVFAGNIFGDDGFAVVCSATAFAKPKTSTITTLHSPHAMPITVAKPLQSNEWSLERGGAQLDY